MTRTRITRRTLGVLLAAVMFIVSLAVTPAAAEEGEELPRVSATYDSRISSNVNLDAFWHYPNVKNLPHAYAVEAMRDLDIHRGYMGLGGRISSKFLSNWEMGRRIFAHWLFKTIEYLDLHDFPTETHLHGGAGMVVENKTLDRYVFHEYVRNKTRDRGRFADLHYGKDDRSTEVMLDWVIEYLADKGIINGKYEDQLPPQAFNRSTGEVKRADDAEGDLYFDWRWITRAEMASLLVRAFNIPPGPDAGFTDLNGTVHTDAINALAASGITKGCSTTQKDFADTFCPNDRVTAGQSIEFLWRIAGRPTRNLWDQVLHESPVAAEFWLTEINEETVVWEHDQVRIELPPGSVRWVKSSYKHADGEVWEMQAAYMTVSVPIGRWGDWIVGPYIGYPFSPDEVEAPKTATLKIGGGPIFQPDDIVYHIVRDAPNCSHDWAGQCWGGVLVKVGDIPQTKTGGALGRIIFDVSHLSQCQRDQIKVGVPQNPYAGQPNAGGIGDHKWSIKGDKLILERVQGRITWWAPRDC